MIDNPTTSRPRVAQPSLVDALSEIKVLSRELRELRTSLAELRREFNLLKQ